MKITTLLLSFVLFLTLFGSTAEAAYVYGSYGNGYSSPFSSSNSLSYPGSGRTNVYDESFSFPRGRGSMYYSNQRDSVLDSFSQSQNIDRTNTVNDRFVDNFFGSQANYNRNLLDLSQQQSSTNSGSSFDGGSSQYRFGDCSTPSYQRSLHGDYKGSRNDFTITETICGGQQMNLQRNFGNGNTYANSASSNGRALQDSLNAGLTTRTTNTDRTNTVKETQQLKNSVSYQKSSFGQGYTLVFN